MGANVNLATVQGDMVLHMLCYGCGVDEANDKAAAHKITWLVERGANPNLPNRREVVPLEFAMRVEGGKRPHQAIALLEAGADVCLVPVRQQGSSFIDVDVTSSG